MIRISLVHECQSRIRENLNNILAVLGKSGSGKSWLCLSLAEQIDPTFSIKRVCFSPTELLRLITKHIKGEDVLPLGACIVVEEAGVQYSNRAWQSVTNRIISALSQSFRSLNFTIFFNLPNFKRFDIQVQEMVHFILIVKKKNIAEGVSYSQLREVFVNHFTGELKNYPPEWIKSNGSRSMMSMIAVKRPSPKLVEEYEARKKEWQTVKYDELLKKAENYELLEKLKIIQTQQKMEKAGETMESLNPEPGKVVVNKQYKKENDGRMSEERRAAQREVMRKYWEKKRAEKVVAQETTTQAEGKA